MDENRQKREVTGSKQVLEEKLGKSVELFAFPYSDGGDEAEVSSAILQHAGYRAAFLCGGGLSFGHLPLGDRFRISRLAVYRDTDLDLELSTEAI